MITKSNRRVMPVILTLLLAIALSISGFVSFVTPASADTFIYCGKLGFNADTMLNDDGYNQEFSKYFGANLQEDLIIDLDLGFTRVVFDANEYLNTPGYDNIVQFGNDHPAATPPNSFTWDGMGDPSDFLAVKQAGAALVFDIIKAGNSSTDNITGNLNLVANDSTFGNKGVSISWVSSNNAVIAPNGTVTPGGNDTDVTLTATLTKNQVTDTKVFTVKVKAIAFDLGVPNIKPGIIPANTDTEVWVTIMVPHEPAELASPVGGTPVELLVPAGGGQWQPKGYLYDDGNLAQHGDEILSDQVYSNKFIFNEPNPGTLDLRFKVTTVDNVEHFVDASLTVTEAPGAEEIQQVLGTNEEAKQYVQEFFTQNPNSTPAEALGALEEELKNDPNVESTNLDGNLLEINHANGLTSFVQIVEEGDEDNSNRGQSARSEREAQQAIPVIMQTTGEDYTAFRSAAFGALEAEDTESIYSRTVLIWAPFAAEFAPWDETAGIIDKLNQSDLGFDVVVHSNETADVNSLKNISEYGLVVLATHGSNGRWLGTGEIVTDNNKYALEQGLGQIAVWQNMKVKKTGEVVTYQPVYAVNHDWFSSNLTGTFPNSVIVNNSCESTKTDDLWNTFSNRGAGAYFGYSKIVSSKFCVEQVVDLVEKMAVDLKTTGEAYTAKTDPYSAHQAVWQMRGKNNLVFSQGLINGSFEMGMKGWLPDGDGRVITGLASLKPTHGERMGIISTGLGYTEMHGSISQTFKVPQDATKISFNCNYMSEEFLEYIGSVYDDPFVVTIETADNQAPAKILDLSVKKVADMFGAVYCSTGNPNYLNCGGDLVYVSPQIVFDQNDVWMTGWQYWGVDISAFQGKTVTMKFYCVDQGDTIYSTAVLLDNIKLTDSIVSSVSIIGPGELVVPSQGQNNAKFKSVIKDQYGEPWTTETVTWSLPSPVTGVSVDTSTGEITVDSSAVPGTSFALTATSDKDNSVSSTIMVLLAQESVTSIVVSGPDTISIPASGQPVAEVNYSATVKNHNGQPMAGEAVVWSLLSEVQGVSVNPDTGVVTVENADVTGQGSFTLVATSVSDNSITGTLEVALQGVVINFIYITGPNSIMIPPSGAASVQETYTIMAFDQYEQVIPGETATWSLQSPVQGVTVDENTGVITVENADVTGPGSFYLVATSVSNNSVQVTYGVTLWIMEESEVNSIHINGPYGIMIPPSGSPSVQETYTIMAYDQYEQVMPGETATWGLQSPVQGVTVNENTGVVTVENADVTGPGSFYLVATSVSNNSISIGYLVDLLEEYDSV